MCPLHPELPSHLPPHIIPPGCHRAPALCVLCHRANSYLLPILRMVVYMFQWYSLKSSHPLFFPLSSKAFFMCLLCSPACRIISVIFLDSIYVLMDDICFSLSDLLHSIEQALGSFTSFELTQMHSFSIAE